MIYTCASMWSTFRRGCRLIVGAQLECVSHGVGRVRPELHLPMSWHHKMWSQWMDGKYGGKALRKRWRLSFFLKAWKVEMGERWPKSLFQTLEVTDENELDLAISVFRVELWHWRIRLLWSCWHILETRVITLLIVIYHPHYSIHFGGSKV